MAEKTAAEALEAKRNALRKWRAANKSRCTQYNRDYREAHKEHIVAKNRAWRDAHREEVREYYRARYRRLKAEAEAKTVETVKAEPEAVPAVVDPDIELLKGIEAKLLTDIPQSEKDALRKKRYNIEKKTGKRVRA